MVSRGSEECLWCQSHTLKEDGLIAGNDNNSLTAWKIARIPPFQSEQKLAIELLIKKLNCIKGELHRQ